MEAINELLSMGGYGGYVWPSYLVTAAVLIAMLAASLRLLRSNEATIRDLEKTTKDETGEEKA